MAADRAWTPRRLRAALWTVYLLGAEGAQDEVVRRSWPELPLAGTVDLDELRDAHSSLSELGLLVQHGGRVVPHPRLWAACANTAAEVEHVLAAILEAAPPVWLVSASGGDRISWELVPDDAAEALAKVIDDIARREAFLLARARCVDAAERKRLGDDGERVVAAACRAELSALGRDDLAARVRIVSTVSDELGYDVTAPGSDGGVRRIEVKATRSTSSTVAIHLTRNEFTVGLADPSWSLVVVRVGEAVGEVVGWTSARALAQVVPTDVSDIARWEVARVRISVANLVPGLPRAA